ncbi:hypothetical protein MF672_050225 [Actinomadura sp. ATCC 31491]|uniref:GNAT family N-acetyltransferase n=1 Tax=Actinomadura luzonensis TaxID=2805427 RepID=A0ABT0GBE5_9ACTN|nr:hypothetical protein [Actinomadura luzonensis]
MRFVVRRVSDPHFAADLTADIFLAALDSAHTYVPGRGSELACGTTAWSRRWPARSGGRRPTRATSESKRCRRRSNGCAPNSARPTR